MNLNIICKKSDLFSSTIYLLRRRCNEYFKDTFIYVNAGEYTQWVTELKTKMTRINDIRTSCSERIWIVAEGSKPNGIMGLVNCIRQEPQRNNVNCIFISKSSEIPKFCSTNPFYKEQLDKNLAFNVFQKNSWGSYRYIRYEEDHSKAEVEHAYLDMLRIGDLSSFSWIQCSPRNIISKDNSCYVYYASLNYKDLMMASERLPLLQFSDGTIQKDTDLGKEFSGLKSNGKRVMGLTIDNSMSTVVSKVIAEYDVPDDWSLLEASTVPLVYFTAYYALIVRGRLENGESILIHCGSGGMGQAAITLALSMGCVVYTTVGSKAKKDFLKKKFPQLKEEHISNSRDTSFEQDILNSTKGRGVDVVLNSLAEDKLFASINCLAAGGRFLELGKYDMVNNSSLGMAMFLKNASFHGIQVDGLFNDRSKKVRQILHQLLQDGICKGIVKPLDATVFNYDEAEEAFRYMKSGQHIGKIVLKLREEEELKNSALLPARINAAPRTVFYPDKSYIIIGGLGGMGLEICQWLADQGAKNVILTSRKGVTTGYQKFCLERWKEQSINVVVTLLNAVKLEEAKGVIALASKLGPVGGVFNLALVLRDALVENQTVQNFIDVCECKIQCTMNMDMLTRELCPELDCFVCFSSVICGQGNAGQSNYGYANSVVERMCENRVNEGFPGLAIQWGIVDDVGYVNERESEITIKGYVPQKISSCLLILDTFLRQNHPVVSSSVPSHTDKSTKSSEKEDLMSYMVTIFGIKDTSSLNPEATLTELGMDSLMAAELKNILEFKFDSVMSIPELRNLKVKDLKKISDLDASKDNKEDLKNKTHFKQYFIEKFIDISRNELLPFENVVHMNSITEGTPLFFIHPIEGTVTALQSLADLLLCPVYGIQYTQEAPRDSMEHLASWYWKCQQNSNSSVKTINLAGYSYGGMVASEMTLQAQQDPKNYPEIRNLICLETPYNYKFILQQVAGNHFDLKTVEDEITILNLFISMFPQIVYVDNNELEKMNSFEERIRYTAEKIATVYPSFSSEEILTVCQMFVAKRVMGLKYSLNYKLKRDLYQILASASLRFADFKKFDLKTDFEKICEGNVITHIVEGNHHSMLKGDSVKQLSKILNEICTL